MSNFINTQKLKRHLSERKLRTQIEQQMLLDLPDDDAMELEDMLNEGYDLYDALTEMGLI